MGRNYSRIHVLTLAAATLLTPAFSLAQTSASTEPPPATQGSPSYEFRGGRWIPVETNTPTTLPVDETLDLAEDYLQRGGWRAARKILLRWFETHDRRAPNRDRATFLLAQCYFQSGNRILSFYHFDEVMDLYPESRLYPAALQRQYDIADAYLSGFKNRVLYMSILGMEDEAVEMLFRIQSRAPGSPIAEKALLRTADYYYATSQFDLAADAYGAYVKAYPRSPLVARVKLRQAFSQMALYRGTRFDASPAKDARELLADLIVTEPNLAAGESLPSVVIRIDDALARAMIQSGDWYRRTNNLRGAAYMYRLMLATYPESPDAPEAQRRLDRIPEKFKDNPAPTTTPSVPEPGEFFTPPPASSRPASAPSSPATTPNRPSNR